MIAPQTHLLVQKLSKEAYNCVLVYKPQGDKTQIGPVNDDLDIKKNTFVIAFQTKQQLEMFKKHASKIVCVDSTYNTNRYSFPLVTLLVPDEFNKGYPVAFLMR